MNKTYTHTHTQASQIAKQVKNPPAMQETPVPFLGWEDTLEGMAIHSSILAWRIPLDRGAWRTTVHGVVKSQTQLNMHARARTHTHTPFLSYPSEAKHEFTTTHCYQ